MSDGIAPEIGIPRLWDNVVPVSGRTGEYTKFILPHPSTGQRNQFQFRVLYKHFQQHRLAKGARVWVKVRDRSELRSGSVVDLRVVDVLVIDVKLDMDELTTIGLSVIET